MEMEEGLGKAYHGCSASVPSLSERLHCLPCCPNGTFSLFLTGQILSLVGSICCPFSLTLEDQVSLCIAHWCLKSRPPCRAAIGSFGSSIGHLGCGHLGKLPSFARSEQCQAAPPTPPHPRNTSLALRSSFLTLDF